MNIDRAGSRGIGSRLVSVAVAVMAVVGVVALLVVVAGGDGDSETAVMSLEVGDCVRLELPPAGPELARVPVVDCDEPHTGEVFHVGELDPDGDRPYPASDEALFREIAVACVGAEVGAVSPFERYVGVPWSRSELDVFPIAPDPDAWEPTAGRFVCLAIPATDDDELVGSVRDPQLRTSG